MKFLRAAITLAVALVLANGFAAGNTLVIGIYQDVATLSPVRTTSAANLRTIVQIVERLFRIDPASGDIVPYLATGWERVDDNTITITLRPGITFTNGEPMNAEAVKFSLETLAVEPTHMNHLGAVERVDIIDDLTVNVVTSIPIPVLPLTLAQFGHVIPPAYYQEVGPDGFAAKPIGTGPFMFESQVPGQSITLVRNDNYWDGASAIESIVYRPIPEDSARISALLAGEIDIATNVPGSQYNRIDNANGVHIASVVGYSAKLGLLDALPGSPLEDPRVRQAVNYAVNKELLLEVLNGGHGTLSTCQTATPQFFGHNPNLQPYPYDPDKARALLAEAGYANGVDVVFKYRVSSGDDELSEAISAMLEEVGFRVEQVLLEGGEFLRQLTALELRHLAVAGISTAPDAIYPLKVWVTGASYSYYSNADFDAAILEAEQTIDENRRRELLHTAAQIACDDPPLLYLFTLEELYGVSDRVIGWNPTPDNWFNFTGVTLQ